jgi:hypothetical protein
MKRTSIPNNSQQKRPRASGGGSKPTPKLAQPWLPRWLVVCTVVAMVGAGSYAVLHFFVLTRVPRAMVGTWLVLDVQTNGGDRSNQALKGGRFVFRRDGAMIVQANMDGKGYTIKATVEVEDETLRITTVNPNNGRKVTDVQTIRTLEGDRFVIEDRKGTVLVMDRLRE